MSDWATERTSRMMKDSDGKPVAFQDVDPSTFPFVIRTHDEESGELLWEQTVHGPGIVQVPGFHPRKVRCTVIYLRSGEVVVTTSEGQTLTTTRAGND